MNLAKAEKADGQVGTEEMARAPARKPWRTPQVIVSEMAHANHASDPPTSDGTPASQLS